MAEHCAGKRDNGLAQIGKILFQNKGSADRDGKVSVLGCIAKQVQMLLSAGNVQIVIGYSYSAPTPLGQALQQFTGATRIIPNLDADTYPYIFLVFFL